MSLRVIAKSLLFLTLVFCGAVVEVCLAAPQTLVIPAGKLFSVTGFAGRRTACAQIGSRIVSGKKSPGRHFTPATVAKAALKKQIKSSSGKTRSKLQRKLAKLVLKIEQDDTACRTDWLQRNCMPILTAKSLTLEDDTAIVEVELGPSSVCADAQLSYEVVRAPSIGRASIENTSAVYSVGFEEGVDTFSFRACAQNTTACTAPQEVSVNVSRRCLPSLSSKSISLEDDNSQVHIELGPSSVCTGGQFRYEVVRAPSIGSVYIENTSAAYSVGFVVGVDTFSFRACLQNTTACTAPQEVTVNVSRRCLPGLTPKTIVARENSSEDIVLGPESECTGGDLEYEITSAPAAGTFTIVENTSTYEIGFFPGSYTASFRACLPASGACTESRQITITVRAADFSGRSDSLRGYKDNITRTEATYLVKKIALGGCQEIIQKGVNEGLRAMVQELLNDNGGGCTYTLPLSGNSTTQDPNVFSYRKYNPAGYSPGLNFQHWRMDLLYRVLLTNARYGSGLQEYMTWIFWHNNFATDVWIDNFYEAKLHYNLLWQNALGYVGDFFYEFFGPRGNPATSIRRRSPGIDPALPYDPDSFMVQNGSVNPNNPYFEYSGSRRAYGDYYYHKRLSNDENTNETRNENLGRELLELHIAGARDPITGLSNYNEEDVVASTYAISGYTNFDPDTGSHITRGGAPDDPNRFWFTYNPERSAAGAMRRLTFFSGTPYERNGVFSSTYSDDNSIVSYLPFLMNEWSAPSRYFAAKMFTHIVHTQPTEEIVQELAGRLLTYHPASNSDTGAPELKNYSIKDILGQLLTSEAMFSDRARGQGVFSPFEVLVGMMRMGDLPLTTWSFPEVVMNALGEAQQALMAPPTVFGWKNYGVVRQGIVANGEEWLRVASLIGTYRGIFTIVNWAYLDDSQNFDPIVIFPNGTATTAAQAVDIMLTRFNLVGNDTDGNLLISPAERNIMINYLNDTGTAQGWNAADWSLRRKKMGGLYALIVGHPANLRR